MLATIEEFLVEKDPLDPNVTQKVKPTTGFHLLGTPVGSPVYAEELFTKQVEEVCASVKALNAGNTDIQIRLHIFTHCTIQKLLYLLGADIMHNLLDIVLEGDNN